MTFPNFKIKAGLLSLILQVVALLNGNLFGFPQESYNQLHLKPVEDLPEKVHVKDLLTTHGNAAADGFVYVLDSIPANWIHVGKGKLSVSNKYSRAGVRSIRWDWKAGDTIRIKDAGIVSDVRVGYTGSNAKSEEIGPFALSVFMDKKLPENTGLNLYFKRKTDNRNGQNEIRLTRMRYFLNFPGTWYRVGGVALRKNAMVFGAGNHVNVVDRLPDGIAAPELNEIVIQAPTAVGSGTLFLDRLITLAEVPDRKTMDARAKSDYLNLDFTSSGKLTDNRAWPFDLSVEADIATIGYVDQPLDPTSFDQAATGYFGHVSKKPPVPRELTATQKAYVTKLRNEFFVAPQRLDATDKKFVSIEARAREILARDCVPLTGGKYKFRESINFGGDRIYFGGDLCSARKNVFNFPASIKRGDLNSRDVKTLFLEYGGWYTRCPDSKPVEALFKAFLDWYRYQVSMPLLASPSGTDSAITGQFAKYGGRWLIRDAREMIAVLRKQGTTEDLAYARYIGEIIVWMSKVKTYTFAVDPLPGISREWSADSTYYGLFYEPDDRKFFQMLKASQEAFTRTFTISDINRRGMIKPDYTFYHHGHCSYWGGNFFEHIAKARQFAKTPLEFSFAVRRNMAWYIPRYTFGAYNFPSTVKGGQESTNNTLRVKHWAKELLDGKTSHAMVEGWGKPSTFSIDRFPRRDVFEYLYEMDWNEVPAARKFMSGVLGMTTYQSTEVKEQLLKQYPKLKTITPQSDIHLSLNWSGATSYSRGMTRVQIGSYNDKDPTPSRPHGRWSWNRGYGCLYILENDRTGSRPPLGADYEGYSWSKAPGTTMPAVTDQEYVKHHTMDGVAKSKHGVELNTVGSAGNGSLTFNETEERFGRAGNFSFQTLKSENLQIWQKLFGIDGVAGQKSYHLSGDRIVCLGSGFQANTDRPMETILFQESLDKILWQGKNPARWNPGKQVVNLNGQTSSGPFHKEIRLEQPNYVISPFGHAWIIPGKQHGKLKINWSERETLFNYRIGLKSVTPGKRMTKGTGVIAMLDQGPSRKETSHHFSILLNSDGKSPEELQDYVETAIAIPDYKVLEQNRSVHAVVFNQQGQKPLYSYVIFEGDEQLGLPVIRSANKTLNVMFQIDSSGELILSVCDTHVGIESDKSSRNFDRSRSREIKITFDPELRLKLVSSQSGLPQTNPPLQAQLVENVLTYTTRNAVTDTFRLKLNGKSKGTID